MKIPLDQPWENREAERRNGFRQDSTTSAETAGFTAETLPLHGG